MIDRPYIQECKDYLKSFIKLKGIEINLRALQKTREEENQHLARLAEKLVRTVGANIQERNILIEEQLIVIHYQSGVTIKEIVINKEAE